MNGFIEEGDLKQMTVGIAMICTDGIVIGADRKFVTQRSTRIKSLEDKIFTLSFRDHKKLLVCIAGTIDHAKRAMNEINPYDYDSSDCSTYRDWVETTISRLRLKLSDRGLIYDAALLFGMIDNAGQRPVIGHIAPSGIVEIKYDGYFTTGIAAPYAEIVLKDSYTKSITIQDAKLIVGGLIEKISKVDNDVEGMDVKYISATDENIGALSWQERQAITSEDSFSFDLKQSLPKVRVNIKFWVDLVEKAESEQRFKQGIMELIKDKSTHNGS